MCSSSSFRRRLLLSSKQPRSAHSSREFVSFSIVACLTTQTSKSAICTQSRSTSIDMDQNPTCYLYYASTGSWTGQQPLITRIEQGVSDLKRTSLFTSVSFAPIDLEELKK